MIRTSPEILQAVERATRRSSGRVHEEMRSGIQSLATIASLAPWVGIFGTILGIIASFPGLDGQKTNGLGVLFSGLSQSFWPMALGLAVGLMSLWFYLYLSRRIRSFDIEM